MAVQSYSIDPAHSHVGFAVKHLVISTVRGNFTEFDVEAQADPEDLTTAKLTATVQAASVNTGVNDRDNHLRSDDFFNAEQYPTLTFSSTSIEHAGSNRYKVAGDLTIRDVTKPIELDVEIEGPTNDPYGNERFGLSAKGKINRIEYGLKYNPALEAGGLVVAEDVRLDLEAELVAVKAPETAGA
jgi:polyisoprenoid-binding protein YceI